MTGEANAPETMKVEWTHSVDDAVASVGRNLDKSSTARRGVWMGWFGLPALIVFLVLGSLWDQLLEDPAGLLGRRHLWFVCVSTMAIIWLFIRSPLYWKRLQQESVRRMYQEKGNERLFKYISVTVTPEALHQEGQHIKSTYRWKVIERIEAGESYLDFHIVDLVSITIPRSAFQTGDEFQAFVELARKYHAAATGQPAAGA